MSDNEIIQGDECGCEVCADVERWHRLTGEQKLAEQAAESDQHDVRHWRNYALGLEAENYDLEQENMELREELSAEQAKCQNCGRNK